MRRETGEELRHFMRNVAFLRAEHGLSKREMAKRLGISVRTLNELEQGRFPARLGASVIYNIYREFGVRPACQFTDLSLFGARQHGLDDQAPSDEGAVER